MTHIGLEKTLGQYIKYVMISKKKSIGLIIYYLNFLYLLCAISMKYVSQNTQKEKKLEGGMSDDRVVGDSFIYIPDDCGNKKDIQSCLVQM